MPRVTNTEYLNILDIINQANRCENIDGLLNAVCHPILELFHSECFTLQLVQGYPQHIEITESRSFKSDNREPVEEKYYTSLYKKGYFQYSPLLKEALFSPQIIHKIGNSISVRDWERSDFYNEFIAPQHLFWEMFLPLDWKNNLEGMITLWRSRKQSDFSNNDMLKAEIVARHLVLTLNNFRTIVNLRNLDRQDLQNEQIDSHGLLLLDDDMKPVYTNRKSRELCFYLSHRAQPGSMNDFEKGEFPIPSCIVNDCFELLDLVKAEERLALWPRESIIFTENGKKIRIESSLMWKPSRTINVPQFVVTLLDITGEVKYENTLRGQLRLSQREGEIFYLLAAGKSYREIADELFISKHTVHTHIKNIYRKLGIKNKMDLYRCVQALDHSGS